MEKRYIIWALTGLALIACKEKELTDAEILAGRPETDLQVSYASEGTPVSSIAFTSKAAVRTVEVNVNNENLRWNLESNRDWCVVRPESHRGSGSVTLEIAANEDFEARDVATLTFVAGNFRGHKLTVTQSGGAFIISQPFFLSPIGGGSYALTVTTEEGTSWDVSGNDWLTATKGETRTTDGYSVTPLTLQVARNASPTRYGILTLTAGDGRKDEVALSQFGTDLDYDAEGVIFFDRESASKLSFKAPAFTVDSFTLPEYATSEVSDNGDGTVTITLTLEENLSDCSEIRESEMSCKLTNASVTVIDLPLVRQDYLPAHGLVTAAGVQRFAAAVAAGEDTSDWEKDGTVVLIDDIDMEGVTGWTGIGTDDKPFSGKFDGAGHSILNLKKATAGFFHRLKGATVQRLTIGHGCTIYVNDEKDGETFLGGIADVAEGSTLTACTFAGLAEFAGTCNADERKAYVGGILGSGDASTTVTGCKLQGEVAVSSPSDADLTVLAGGMAGRVTGTVSNCEMSGSVGASSAAGSLRLGGILSQLSVGTSVSSNSFLGTINQGGASRDICIGGLYALVEQGTWTFDNASDKSVSMGTISLGSTAGAGSELFAGGMVGLLEGGSTLSVTGYDLLTNFKIDCKTDRAANFYVTGGVLGACAPEDDPSTVNLTGLINRGGLSIEYVTAAKIQFKQGRYGGLAGYVNGPLTVKDCSNEGVLGTAVTTNSAAPYSTNTASYSVMIAGLVAVANGGDAEFTHCENKAVLTNYQYNNRVVPVTVYEGRWCANVCAGILGGFDYVPENTWKLTMTKCVNTGHPVSYRGLVGGIAGYVSNATLTDCSSNSDLTVSLYSNASHKGGLVAVADGTTTLTGCTVQGGIRSANPGGALGTPGGLAGYANGPLTIRNCAWYGTVEAAAASGVYFGALVGTGRDDTVISDCKFGGSVQGVTVSENNLETLAVGNGKGSLSGITYWNGN